MTYKLSDELITARSCYQHLAGTLGIAVVSALTARGYLIADKKSGTVAYTLSPTGKQWSQQLGIGTPNRTQVTPCMDHSHQQPHIAGPWPVDFYRFLFNQKYITRAQHSRSLTITPKGKKFLNHQLSIQWH